MDKPVNRVNIFNTALPGIGTGLLTAAIKPYISPSVLRIYICLSIAGIIYVSRTVSGATLTEALNSGSALVAGASYMFEVPWVAGEAVDITCSTTTGTINKLQIDESWS